MSARSSDALRFAFGGLPAAGICSFFRPWGTRIRFSILHTYVIFAPVARLGAGIRMLSWPRAVALSL